MTCSKPDRKGGCTAAAQDGSAPDSGAVPDKQASSELEYQPRDTVVVEALDERYRLLREAYLEGRLSVDSRRLAENIMAFERRLASAIQAEPRRTPQGTSRSKRSKKDGSP